MQLEKCLMSNKTFLTKNDDNIHLESPKMRKSNHMHFVKKITQIFIPITLSLSTFVSSLPNKGLPNHPPALLRYTNALCHV